MIIVIWLFRKYVVFAQVRQNNVLEIEFKEKSIFKPLNFTGLHVKPYS